MSKDSDLKAFAPIKIVSLEQAVAAPLTTRRFAQAGAEVIKIERPEGDFARTMTQWYSGKALILPG